MIWHGPLCISKKAELDIALAAYTDVEFTPGSMRDQTRLLIEAIALWLEGGCGEMKCRKSV
jgi:hypothetical protein